MIQNKVFIYKFVKASS